MTHHTREVCIVKPDVSEWSDDKWHDNLIILSEISNGFGSFSDILKRAQADSSRGRQLDWGAWMYTFTKQELLEYLRPEDFPARGHPQVNREEFLGRIQSYPDEQEFVVVVTEL